MQTKIVGTTRSQAFVLGGFLARHEAMVRYHLGASECETMSLASLLETAAPEHIARWSALDLGYSHPQGAGPLRVAIAARYQALQPGHVLCCAGAQEGLACIAQALLGPDDHAIVIVPVYQPSEWTVTSRCAASGVPLENHGGWELDVDRIAASIRPNTRLVLVNFPNSPTGACIDSETLGSLVALCRRHGLWLVNDEVYRLTGGHPDWPQPQVADIYERGISIDALSKSFGLPGLRVGWVACRDRDILALAMNAKSGLSSCLASPSEMLAQMALQGEHRIIARNRAIASGNWSCLRSVLDEHAERFEWPVADAGVLAFPRYLGAEGAEDFAARLVRHAGVLVLPSTLWRTPLASVPEDHIRIGLGTTASVPGLGALDRFLRRERDGYQDS